MYGLSRLKKRGPNYIFGVSCPRCGGITEPLTLGNVVGGTQASAVARCLDCKKEWLLVVYLRNSAAKVPPRIRRGTRLLPVES